MKDEPKMKEIFLNEKPVMTLVTIRKSREEIYGSIISRKIDTTYAHAVKIISQMEEEGLLRSEKQGRKKILTLTEKGERYSDLFIEMLELFEEDMKEGNIEGDEKRNISVFLGEEQILEKDPLNGEFKIPIDANEVNDRELKLVSNDREIRFSLDVNSPQDSESKDSNDCITPSSQGILGVNMPHNEGLIGADNSRPCFNSSTDDLDNPLDSTRQDILQDFTGQFSQRVADNQLFTNIRARMNQIQYEINLIFSSIFY